MKLLEIFEQLTAGELSQVSFGKAPGVITVAEYPKIIPHINLGLLALFKRFPLKQDRLTLDLVMGQISYNLVGDILKVEKVFTGDGVELDLNDESALYGCTTPSAKVLRVPKALVFDEPDTPYWLDTDSLELVYRASLPQIVADDVDAEEYEVDLPYSHLEPLLLFIASRVHTPTGMTDRFSSGNNYYAKYEKACLDLEVANLKVDQGAQNERILRNGWV